MISSSNTVDDEEITIEDEAADELAQLRSYFSTRTNNHHSIFEWTYLAKWSDENPFMGYRPPGTARTGLYQTNLSTTVAKMYTSIGGRPDEDLPHKPADEIRTAPTSDIRTVLPDWLKLDNRGYKKDPSAESAHQAQPRSVIEVSKILCGLLAEPIGGTMFGRGKQFSKPMLVCDEEFIAVENARKEGAAIIAHEMVDVHPDVCTPDIASDYSNT